MYNKLIKEIQNNRDLNLSTGFIYQLVLFRLKYSKHMYNKLIKEIQNNRDLNLSTGFMLSFGRNALSYSFTTIYKYKKNITQE